MAAPDRESGSGRFFEMNKALAVIPQ